MALLIAIGLMWPAAPAWAHGDEEGEADTVALVEQALAIVVNTPGAIDEALERVESALAAEAESPTGDLAIASLEEAAAALATGDLHEAEDALISALGADPHEPLDEQGAAVAEQAPASPDESATESTLEPTDESAAQPTALPTDRAELPTAEAPAHGLTDRVAGGFQTPSSGDAVALIAALALAIGGLVLVTRGRATHS